MNDTTTSSTLKYGRWEINANTLPPKAISYLLHNGFNQSMTDAAAASKADKAKVLRDAGFEQDALVQEGKASGVVSAEGLTALATAADEWRQARFTAICAGEVGARVGGGAPRKDSLTRAMEDIVDEQIRAICTQKSVAMPKGDVLRSAREKLIARGGEGLRSQAQARLAAANAMADELGDIFESAPAADGPASADNAQGE